MTTSRTIWLRTQLPPSWTTLPHLLVGVWALGMIAVPIFIWTVGDATLPWVIAWNVVVLSLTALVVLAAAWPFLTVMRALAVVLIGAWLIEYIGSTTGLPFGAYHYTEQLQPQLGGVPLLIPLAWLMMLPAAWTVAALLAPHNRIAFTAVAGAALTAWDLFLDPQMVAWGFWTWHTPGGYFGIPWLNFLGWFASGMLLTWLAAPPPLASRPLLLVYTLTWLLQTVGLGFFWAMPGPALVGALAMGLFVWLAWRRALRAPQPLA